jgi:putative FmdB family regulatory protein
MPTYQYACRACGHSFEAVQSMTEEPLRECPRCGGELRKVYAPPAIAFRGSGFYATDHGKRAKKPAAEGGEGASKGDAAGAAKGSGERGGDGGTPKDPPGSGSKGSGPAGGAEAPGGDGP